MFGGNKLKIEDELYEKLTKCAAAGGYASPEEFATHVLEREVEKILGGGSTGDAERDPEEEVRKRLQGLGYIE
jgi:hypothetical protein